MAVRPRGACGRNLVVLVFIVPSLLACGGPADEPAVEPTAPAAATDAGSGHADRGSSASGEEAETAEPSRATMPGPTAAPAPPEVRAWAAEWAQAATERAFPAFETAAGAEELLQSASEGACTRARGSASAREDLEDVLGAIVAGLPTGELRGAILHGVAAFFFFGGCGDSAYVHDVGAALTELSNDMSPSGE